MLASHCALCGSTGRFAMGVFQTLSAGNMGQLGAPGTGVPADATPGRATLTPMPRPITVAAANEAATPLCRRFTGVPSRRDGTAPAEGEATVTVNGRTVRKLGPGDFFGEMALIDRDLRSATVTADTELRTLMLTQWVFRPFAIKHPDTIWALLELMVKRVREAQSPQD